MPWLACSVLVQTIAVVDTSRLPLIEAAQWALQAGDSFSCAVAKRFQDCAQPWAAVEAWRYAVANLLAARKFTGGQHFELAERTAAAVGRFFATPDAGKFTEAAEKVSELRRQLSLQTPLSSAHPMLDEASIDSAGLGVPFPLAVVQIPAETEAATLQLRGGVSMPLLALSISGRGRPSLSNVAEALQMGVRHLQVSPSVAEVVGQAIWRSKVNKADLFVSVLWEGFLNSAAQLESVAAKLGKPVDMLILPKGEEGAESQTWRHLERLRDKHRVATLGVKDFTPQEVDALPKRGAGVEFAQCVFTPYRPGPSRNTWRDFGQRSVALAATGLLSDWPRPLRPTDDPHVLAIAERTGRSSAQVLIRWALQLGLAVVFHADRVQHVRENLGALGFELPRTEMQLISGLVTLADPVPPGDGFGHPYAPRAVASEL
ncbi:unnamed protein product [Symbiodinium sp. CCMP2456]|nr:unnamed protein product [Symbiodinium sp. CCMP2456]